MFRGIQSVNMDTKGRLPIPARYREQFNVLCAGNLVVTIDTEEKCLLIYPQPYWDDIQEKIQSLPSFNPAARRVQRLLIGHACDLELDGSGRILVPPMLREFASLDKKVVLLGQGKKLELWSEENWGKRSEIMLSEVQDLQALPAEMQSLSL